MVLHWQHSKVFEEFMERYAEHHYECMQAVEQGLKES
jgi:hypothetical protein